jgi:hypothetical protein
MGVADVVGVFDGGFAHMQRIAGIGQRPRDLPHILQDSLELTVIGRRFFVRLREGPVEVDLVSYLDKLTLMCYVIRLGIVADPAAADGFGKLFF